MPGISSGYPVEIILCQIEQQLYSATSFLIQWVDVHGQADRDEEVLDGRYLQVHSIAAALRQLVIGNLWQKECMQSDTMINEATDGHIRRTLPHENSTWCIRLDVNQTVLDNIIICHINMACASNCQPKRIRLWYSSPSSSGGSVDGRVGPAPAPGTHYGCPVGAPPRTAGSAGVGWHTCQAAEKQTYFITSTNIICFQ